MTRVKASIAELEFLQDKSTRALTAALLRVQFARLKGNAVEEQRAQAALSRLITRTMAAADLMGRRRLLLEAKAKVPGELVFASFAERDVPFLPAVPFQEAIDDLIQEAIDDLIRREPLLAVGWREAQRVYLDGGFAAARAATDNVTARIQKILEDSLRAGADRFDVNTRIIKALKSGEADAERAGIDPAGWTRAYADTIFRTNTASAYTAGRMQQARDPAFRKVISGWRFSATRDSDVRKTHLAADGLVATVDDPIWIEFAPPLSWSCRCSLDLVTTREMRSLGIVDKEGNTLEFAARPPGARRDPDFGRATPYG